MKVFCGVQATGRGHLSRYMVVRDILEGFGSQVYGFACGKEIPGYCTKDLFRQGPTFSTKNNRIDVLGSLKYNVRRAPGFLKTVREVTRLVREERFEHAILDFEPLSIRAVRKAGIPYTIFDNQTFALLSLLDTVPGIEQQVRMMRRFVKSYYGSALPQASHVWTYSFVPAEPELPRQVIVPPCVRQEVLNLAPSRGEHMMFYSSVGELPSGLIEFARAHPDVEVRAYVARLPDPAELPRNVKVPQRDSANFLQDLASCRVFMTGAGFESIAECVHLRKPIMVVPIGGQWEQYINAELVRLYKVGATATDWSRATFEAALQHEAPASAEVQQWVSGGRAVLTHVLRELVTTFENGNPQ
ncbi:MAG: glycosyltransferase family protein [Candidatus Sumerlaeaceae bacterium]